MKTVPLIVGGIALLVGLLVGWMVRGAATYNIHQASITAYDDWRVACPQADTKDAHCELSTDVIDKSQGTPNTLGRASITIDKDGKQLLGFLLPFGVALEAGMGLKIGKDPVKIYQYRTCNSVGCIATTPFDNPGRFNNADDVRDVCRPGRQPARCWYRSRVIRRCPPESADAKRQTWFWRLWS
jgi:invasion protein IalB